MQEARKRLPNLVRNKITQIDMGQEKSGLTHTYHFPQIICMAQVFKWQRHCPDDQG